jgi:hypothetical protein
MTEKTDVRKTVSKIRTNSKILIILVVLLCVLFFGFIISANMNSGPKTLQQLYEDTLAGKESDRNFMYNGHVFVHDGFFWIVRVARGQPGTASYAEYNIPFYNSPRQVEDVPYQEGSRNALLGKQIVYLTQDIGSPAEVSLAAIEVGRIVGQRYGLLNLNTKAAITSNASEGSPTITCDDVSRNTGVVYFKISNTTQVYEQDGCLIVEGSSPDEIVRAADRLSYMLLDIMHDPIPFEPMLMPIDSATIEDFELSIYDLQIVKEIHGDQMGGYILKDVADGYFYTISLQIINTGEEDLVFTPGAFTIRVDNQSKGIDYQKQRFLPQKLQLTNTVPVGEQRIFIMAFDLPELNYDDVSYTVRFQGFGEHTFALGSS